MKTKKISSKIIFYNSVLIISLVIFLVIFINNIVYNTHLNVIEREMKDKLNLIELIFIQTPGLYKKDYFNKNQGVINRISKTIDLRITIIDLQGQVIYDSEVGDVTGLDNHRHREEINSSIENKRGSSIRYSDTLKINMLYVAKLSGNLVFRIAKPLYEIDKSLSYIRKMITFSGIFVIFLSLVIMTYISNKISSPIREAVNFALSFSVGDYSKRIMNYSDDEIGNLQKSLNKLADTIVDKINSLLFEQKRLELTIENIHDGIVLIDSADRIQIVNSAFKSILEIQMDASEKVYYEVIRSSSLNSIIKSSLETGQADHFELSFLSGRICEIFIIPIKGEKAIEGILLVLYDVTERKKIDQMKTDLIGNMSHELKTPVTILKGYMETMNEHLDNREMTEQLLEKALANVERQGSLINDILKLNRIEQAPDFSSEMINIRDIIDGCINILKPKADKKNIDIISDVKNADMKLPGNRFLAEEVLFNIIDNAINYNRPEGKINIKAESDEFLTIKIADTGIGIPIEAIDRIFERFYRVDKSRSRATGGTGLGLSIVKHAADLLNWRIGVSSDENGTVFIIKIYNQ